MNKKIFWLTADYFIDVDLPIVPGLSKMYDIDWYVLKSKNSKVEVPAGYSYSVIELKYRAKDPRIIFSYKKIIDKIAGNKPDILYVDFLGFPFFYPLLLTNKKLKNIQIVHAAHNVIPYDGWHNKRLMTRYVNHIFKHNRNFHLFSNFLFDYFTGKYKDKNVFYAPLSLKNYGSIQTDSYSICKEKCNLLFFGNIKNNKRLDVIISAVKSLSEELQDSIHLTVAGACDEPGKYISMIGGCPAISCYFKRIADAEVPELFLKHNFLVLPYENVAQSGPHMIAYNYNLPVIASNIDGFKERIVNNENGFLFEVNNIESLKETLAKAVSLPANDYTEMKNRLKLFVGKNYSLQSILKNYITFFDSLVK
jgi:glycosyltransferase involved in cell wall biosynthesis